MPVLVDASDPSTVKALYDPILQKILFQRCRQCEGTCVHSVSFKVTFDQSEIDNDFSDLFDLREIGGGSIIQLEVDSSGWYLNGPGDTCFIDTSGVPFVADTQYTIKVCFIALCSSESTSDVYRTASLCVNGTPSNIPTWHLGTDDLTNITFGNTTFTGVVEHRSYTDIALLGETNFTFPPDSFDAVVNGTAIAGVLRLDSDSDPAYAEKDFGSPWTQNCGGTVETCVGACCFNNRSCVVELESACEAAGGNYQGDRTDCLFDLCPGKGACCHGTSCTNTFGRAACEGDGGVYYGDGFICDVDTCGHEPAPLSACCVPNPDCPDPGCDCAHGIDCACAENYCLETTQITCEGMGGGWSTWTPGVGGWHCIQARCFNPSCTYEIPIGGCCDTYFDPGGCIITDQDACNAGLGSYLGDGSDCSGGCP